MGEERGKNLRRMGRNLRNSSLFTVPLARPLERFLAPLAQATDLLDDTLNYISYGR